jgi:trehalose synthase
MTEVHLGARPLERFEPLLGKDGYARIWKTVDSIRAQMQGRVLWNVNSTAVGGGVAEMLRPLLAYSRGAGIDARWLVIDGNPEFFRVTKRLHHALHGSPGDGSPLGAHEHQLYEETLRRNATLLAGRLRARDVVLLHDPQTAGLAPHLPDLGVLPIWRCHIGHDVANEEVERGWVFLQPYLANVPAFVFSREAYVPELCDHGKATVIQPSIDPFSPKNQELDPATVRSILIHTGLVEGPPAGAADPHRPRGGPPSGR